MRLEDLVKIQEEGGKNSECTNQNTQVCQALLSKVEPINVDEDDDERFEPDIKQTVDQGDIKIESEHDPRFLDGQYASNRQRATINLPSVKFRVNGLTRDMIAISLVDMPSLMSSASHRKFWLPVSFLSLLVRRSSKAGLRQTKHKDDPAESTEPDEPPDRPCPVLMLGSEPTDEWSKNRSTDCRYTLLSY